MNQVHFTSLEQIPKHFPPTPVAFTVIPAYMSYRPRIGVRGKLNPESIKPVCKNFKTWTPVPRFHEDRFHRSDEVAGHCPSFRSKPESRWIIGQTHRSVPTGSNRAISYNKPLIIFIVMRPLSRSIDFTTSSIAGMRKEPVSDVTS